MDPNRPHPHGRLTGLRAGLGPQGGFSLIELMVAMTLSLLLLAGVLALTTNASQSQRQLERSSRLLDNARYAMALLSAEVEHAGFYGRFDNLAALPGALPDPCDLDVASLEDDLPFVVQGYDAPVGNPPPQGPGADCLSDADHLDGTDILVLRRTSSAVTPLAALVAGEAYLQSHTMTRRLDQAVSVQASNEAAFDLFEKDAATRSPIRKYRVDIYYVSPCKEFAAGQSSCTAAADGGSPIPTLTRLELTASGGGLTLNRVPLVEGIQNLQVDYGIDRNDDGAPDETTPGTSGDAYEAAPSLAEWEHVVTLRLHLLARSIEPSAGHDDTKTYRLGLAGTLGPFNDQFKRRVFAQVTRLVNRSARREN